jgi:hypothetical protein
MSRPPFLQAILLLTVLMAGCSPSSSPSLTAFPTRVATEIAPASQAAALALTSTLTMELSLPSTPTLTPLTLPGPYRTALLNAFDTPHTYIDDTCQYLHEKWSSTNSTPGTVVMVIMFHKITNATITDPSQISEYNFRRLMSSLHRNGFQAINTQQLAGFLEHNSRIPERSVLLVTDDKHPGGYFAGLFHQYWVDYGWPVVNAWISDDLTTSDLWQQQEDLNAAGWVDYQAHGVLSAPITRESAEDYILGELKGSIDVFHEHFNKMPIAIIWPGGGFTPLAAGMARQLGYRLGFTTNPRGPLMFNWIPLADYGDPKRDTWIPEGPVHDPLMVLPRYWDTDAISHLDDVIRIGQGAAVYAEGIKSSEMEYYNLECSSLYGPIY